MRTMRLIVALSCCGAAHAFGPAIGAASVAGFLGWAFQGVGPSKDAAKVCRDAGPSKIRGLNRALLFGNGEPAVALYCGAKVRKASYRGPGGIPTRGAAAMDIAATPRPHIRSRPQVRAARLRHLGEARRRRRARAAEPSKRVRVQTGDRREGPGPLS